jgi:hypothetical protein
VDDFVGYCPFGAAARWENPLGRGGRRRPPACVLQQEAICVVLRVLGIAAAILIVVWVVSDPVGAGDTVHGWINQLITFFHHLA